jgi:hypothetical protein
VWETAAATSESSTAMAAVMWKYTYTRRVLLTEYQSPRRRSDGMGRRLHESGPVIHEATLDWRAISNGEQRG